MQPAATITLGVVILVAGFGAGYATASHTMPAAPMVHDAPVAHDMDGAMAGMNAALEGKTGDELDKAFIDGMIVHHEGAVSMAQALLAGTARPELIKLGNDIITAQTGEIEMMKQWRTQWFGQ